MESLQTLEQLLELEKGEPYAQLVQLLAHAARELSLLIASAPLNHSRESTAKKLELIANDLFLEKISSRNLLYRIVTPHATHPIVVGPPSENPLLLAIHPLDGASALETNGVTATVFGIYRDVWNPFPSGRALQAAGYFLYGPSTQLVLSTVNGVHELTLDPKTSQLIVSRLNIRCPEQGSSLCANVAHFSQWPDAVQTYLDTLVTRAHVEQVSVALKYTGAFAPDAHRILYDGGIYVYPPDSQHWSGKIRLLYESIPLAFLFERAGGASSNVEQSLLNVQPRDPHQQDHTVLGSQKNVQDYVVATLAVSNTQKRREGA